MIAQREIYNAEVSGPMPSFKLLPRTSASQAEAVCHVRQLSDRLNPPPESVIRAS
ncbi:hypothetical protein [Polaromonas sp.]|uniref:hypothetical protein n=1 Tax=Polaromonas sp. TaxID=1869339 RepID=UPI0027319E73|nr:hypothetical protein [Polaromonas sp.]MDP1740560.1 hypothetical protein [Polaromonas sp.]